jgi:hypothetical protein
MTEDFKTAANSFGSPIAQTAVAPFAIELISPVGSFPANPSDCETSLRLSGHPVIDR